jgi:hypothetical protein
LYVFFDLGVEATDNAEETEEEAEDEEKLAWREEANTAAAIAARMASGEGAEPIMASMRLVAGSEPIGIGMPEVVNMLALNIGMGRLCIGIIVLGSRGMVPGRRPVLENISGLKRGKPGRSDWGRPGFVGALGSRLRIRASASASSLMVTAARPVVLWRRIRFKPLLTHACFIHFLALGMNASKGHRQF